MLFIVTYKVPSENIVEVWNRFTSGNPDDEYPEGVKQICRYHGVASDSGVIIVESDSAVDVSRWCSKWSDLAELTAEPAITDEEAYQVCVEALKNRK